MLQLQHLFKIYIAKVTLLWYTKDGYIVFEKKEVSSNGIL
nr:MAG TPA: hypothetical protein [Caudoviricetes sp.]